MAKTLSGTRGGGSVFDRAVPRSGNTEDEDLAAVMAGLEVEDAYFAGMDGSPSEGASRRFASFDADGDGLFSEEELDAIRGLIKKNNQAVGLKDDSDGPIRLEDRDGERLDGFSKDERKASKKDKPYDPIELGPDGEDGIITISEDNANHNHYNGPLGDFDYDPKKWAVGYKTVYDSIGGKSVTTEVPVLRYIGSETVGNKIKIPEGVKNLDYTFEDTKVETVPVIPEGVESMHASFKGCDALRRPCVDAKEGESGVLAAINPFDGGVGYGEGGVAMLPDSVKDLSYCFEDCRNLEEGFTVATGSSQLENMDGYARNCGNLTTILDVSQTRFLPVSAQTDAYDGINTRMIKSIGEVRIEQTDENGMTSESGVLKFDGGYCGISLYANEGSMYASGKTETKPYSVDEQEHLDYVKALQAYRANDRMYLADPSAIANATNGMATMGTYTDSNGQTVYTDDPTLGDAKPEEKGGLLSVSGGKASGLGGLLGSDTGKLIQRLGFGFLEYSVIKKFAKNPLVALGITAGGQALGILPGTIDGMGKAISAVGRMFGEDSSIGGMLVRLGDRMSGTAEGKAGDTGITREEASGMNAVADAKQAYEALSAPLSAENMRKLEDNMAVRGAYTAEYGTFQELAEVQEGYGVFNDVKMASEASMEAFAVAMMEKAEVDGGELSAESKAELTQTAKQILQGWSTYGEEASDALREKYGGNPDEQAKGEAGLGKMMRSAVQPDLELIKGLNEKYGFLSEEDMAEIDAMEFKGMEGVTLSNYAPGKSYAPPHDPYVQLTDENGGKAEGTYDEYAPDTYDVDEFLEKAQTGTNRERRTKNYVSQFGDGSGFAAETSSPKGDLEGTYPERIRGGSMSKHDARVVAAESLLPENIGGSGYQAEQD